MPDQHFDSNQPIVGQQVVVVNGTIESKEYTAVEMQIGLVQVKESGRDENDNPNFRLLAGAYGTGVPRLGVENAEGDSPWTMRLELDAEKSTFTKTTKTKPAFGFVLVKLEGGG